MNLQFDERDEAGSLTATYVESESHDASRIDIIVTNLP